MGRIRTNDVKHITDLLVGKYTLNKFSDDFNKNKEVLRSLPEEISSKKVANRVAGYVTFLFKKAREDEKKLLMPSVERQEEEEEIPEVM